MSINLTVNIEYDKYTPKCAKCTINGKNLTLTKFGYEHPIKFMDKSITGTYLDLSIDATAAVLVNYDKGTIIVDTIHSYPKVMESLENLVDAKTDMHDIERIMKISSKLRGIKDKVNLNSLMPHITSQIVIDTLDTLLTPYVSKIYLTNTSPTIKMFSDSKVALYEKVARQHLTNLDAELTEGDTLIVKATFSDKSTKETKVIQGVSSHLARLNLTPQNLTNFIDMDKYAPKGIIEININHEKKLLISRLGVMELVDTKCKLNIYVTSTSGKFINQNILTHDGIENAHILVRGLLQNFNYHQLNKLADVINCSHQEKSIADYLSML